MTYQEAKTTHMVQVIKEFLNDHYDVEELYRLVDDYTKEYKRPCELQDFIGLHLKPIFLSWITCISIIDAAERIFIDSCHNGNAIKYESDNEEE